MTYSLGDTLKELRIKRGLSQDELAEKLNEQFGSTVNKGMISKWENDLGDPRLEHARILSTFFSVKLDQLLGLDEIETIAAHHDGEEWTEEELEEIESFKKFIKMKRNQE